MNENTSNVIINVVGVRKYSCLKNKHKIFSKRVEKHVDFTAEKQPFSGNNSSWLIFRNKSKVTFYPTRQRPNEIFAVLCARISVADTLMHVLHFKKCGKNKLYVLGQLFWPYISWNCNFRFSKYVIILYYVLMDKSTMYNKFASKIKPILIISSFVKKNRNAIYR